MMYHDDVPWRHNLTSQPKFTTLCCLNYIAWLPTSAFTTLATRERSLTMNVNLGRFDLLADSTYLIISLWWRAESCSWGNLIYIKHLWYLNLIWTSGVAAEPMCFSPTEMIIMWRHGQVAEWLSIKVLININYPHYLCVKTQHCACVYDMWLM